MRQPLRTACVLSLALGLAAGALAADGVPDASLGLVKGSVFDVPTPPPVTPNDTAPGEMPPLARPYAGAPPRVPHGVEAFLPITRQENACIGCHRTAGPAAAGEPTPIPPSHFTAERNAPGLVDSQVVGARYVCVTCHVPTTDAAPLVENRFQP
jgi:nitrate reductase (cytochrome), electron transfer subunit